MSEVTQLVSDRVYADDGLADDAKLLVLAALEGDEALAGMVGTGGPTEPREIRASKSPSGAFIKSLSVRGFRGIGGSTTLDLHPGPGLTIVAGRNGSGKSSLAEALEFALTKTTFRWKAKPSALWSRGWRNLHDGAEPQISLVLAEEGVGTTTIQVTWPPGVQEVEHAQVHLQRHSLPRESGLDSLGWTAALENHRPMLSYDELGALLVAEPSRLYDALSRVLGLEEITDAIRRLDAHHKRIDAYRKELGEAKKEITAELVGDDERVAQARALIKATDPDCAAIRALATGVGGKEDLTITSLRALAQMPWPVDANAVADQLRKAVGALSTASDERLQSLQRQLDVWRAAVDLHGHVGDGPCPVCGQGRLDTATAERLREDAAAAQSALAQLSACQNQLNAARRSAIDIVTPPPRALVDQPPAAVSTLCAEVAAAWTAWAERPSDDLALADHLEQVGPALARKVGELRDAAAAELDRLDSTWQPHASRLSSYAERAERWRGHKPRATAAKAALTWLKENDTTLKNERVAPISASSEEIWRSLRQQSNVEFHGLRLAGAATRRHVDIASSVDGQEGAGLTVLSQGELHALALALFLPRAVMPESPFRFVILDDPVQAMDPAKVDGLIDVLQRLAETRQVVVFSHDDRLAEAARRAGGEVTILEVSRGENSQVSVTTSREPARRYLEDAFGMALDQELPDETRRRLLPNMLRFAVEAQARRRYFGLRLSRGDAHADVEDAWQRASTTTARVGLALNVDATRVSDWANKTADRRLVRSVWTAGVHAGLTVDPLAACRATEDVLKDIEAGRR